MLQFSFQDSMSKDEKPEIVASGNPPSPKDSPTKDATEIKKEPIETSPSPK